MKVFSSSDAGQRGVALVIVLSLLVLVTIIALSFFSSVTSEVGAARTEADTASVRQLADSTTQYLIGQIRLATTGSGAQTWASQPGMIRRYNNNGSLDRVFKLYSAGEMVSLGQNGAYDSATDAPPATWSAEPAAWTDLNAPVLGRDASGGFSPIFPILDPRAAAAPPGAAAPLVEGFSYDTQKISGAVEPTSTADIEARLPMPVRWLYQLQDGSLIAPTSISSGTASFAAGNAPTRANPIVARIAFWTDDETSKLNLNTAAGGTPWDDPRYTNGIEQGFSRYKPTKNEFTRYPGHPAATSLLPVFWFYGGLTSPDESLFPVHTPATAFNFQYNDSGNVEKADIRPTLSTKASEYYKALLSFAPRNAWGGSEMGTQPTVILGGPIVPPLDGDRLLATVDEAFVGVPVPGNGRPANALGFRSEDINLLRFFVTTHNRAPDLNPFGRPKVSMWPIAANAAKRTPSDHLLAFCSTLAGNPFYFTRDNATSGTADMSPRNAELIAYLADSMGSNIPGFGGNLQTRYGSGGVSRLLVLAYDYIRGSINLIDTYQADTSNNNAIVAPYAFSVPPAKMGDRGTGQVVPITHTINGTRYKGLGRFPVIKQIGLQFVARAANEPPCVIDANGEPTTEANPMHPWVGPMPGSVSVVDKNDGTWEIDAENAYPVVSGQTHAGLPFLPTRWIADRTILEADGTDPAKIALRQAALNPRYQGPGTVYGASGNSQLLPAPVLIPSGGRELMPHQSEIEAVILIDPVINSPSNPPYNGKYQVRILGLDQLAADGVSLGFPADANQFPTRHNKWNNGYSQGYYSISTFGRTSTASGGNISSKLSFLSSAVVVGNSTNKGRSFTFSGGTITVEIRTEPASGGGLGELIQTMIVDLPGGEFPTPLLPPQPVHGIRKWLVSTDASSPVGDASAAYKSTGVPTSLVDIASANVLSMDLASPLITNANFGVGAQIFRTGDGTNNGRTWFDGATSNDFFPLNFIAPARMTNPAVDVGAKLSADTIRTVEVLYGDTRVMGSLPQVGTEWFVPHRHYHNVEIRAAHSMRQPDASNVRGATDQGLASGVQYHPNGGVNDVDNYRGLPGAAPDAMKELAANYAGKVDTSARYIRSGFPDVTSSAELDDARFQTAWSGKTPFSTIWANGGDYDTGIGLTVDGPYINKPNEGGQMTALNDPRNTNPEFNNETWSFSTYGLNSAPNRQVPSSVIFGSLPVGSTPADSWRTLLFAPNPNSPGHAALSQVSLGGASPITGNAPDYLFLDFFSMPVVEPYAISEPFSTAGRVNMNYEIAPFTYIKRETALRGVLRSALLTAVDDRWAYPRKMQTSSFRYDVNNAPYKQFLIDNEHWGFRYPIHPGETLKQFEQRFLSGDLFRSPSEICSLFLYPALQPLTSDPERSAHALVNWDAQNKNITDWWYDGPGADRKGMTGDNMRERPYASLYPQLTTRSNTYTIHFRVQAVQKVPSTGAGVWVEGRDKVVGEFRGASTIERYIDPAEADLPDFATATTGASLEDYYRYRVLDIKRFAP